MAMQLSDFAFANNIRLAYLRRNPRKSSILVYACGGVVLCAVVWSALAFVDEVARGQARVVPSRSLQIVQSLEGGIVEDILVHEGDMVDQGRALMRIDDTTFSAQLGEVRERRSALLGRVARLTAETRGDKTLSFPADVGETAVAAERALFDARLNKLKQDIDVLALQAEQKQREQDEAQAQLRRVTQTLALLERETDIVRRLSRDRSIPEIELLRAERSLVEMRGQQLVLTATVSRLETAIREAEARQSNAVASFKAMAEDDLAKAAGELAVVEENIRSARDRVRRTELRAPVHGIINKISFNTIGAVIQPAQSVFEIVPIDNNLLLETRIKPSEIAFIRPGQRAVVKITAYDSSVYGSMIGAVERIAADTTSDDNGEAFYRVMVRTEKNHLLSGDSQLPISPGMVASVDIMTGRKSILSYLLKPIVKLRDEALREK